MEKKGIFQKGNVKQWVCGATIGIVNAFFGGGGGMLAVPLLQKTGLNAKSAHATAILVILPVSALSFCFYAFRGFYDYALFIPVAIGVSAGGILGAKLLGKLPEKTVRFIFAALQFLAGLSLIFIKGG